MTEVFSPLDLGLVVICIISGLLAMYRGLTREVLSLVSWALAAAAALYFVFYQKGLAQTLADKFTSPLMLAQIGGGIVIFLLVLLIAHVLTSKVSDRLLDSHVGIIDRVLGFLFGVARGFLLVVVAFVFYGFLTDEKKFPSWVKEAQSLPVIQQAGAPIQSMMGGVAEYVTNKIGNKGGAPVAQPTTDETQAQGQSG